MAVIRCKICGGDLNIADGTTVAVCEYCGTRQTLPKINDEQWAAAFNRGDHFRRISEFDKALSVYERIIAEDDTDAEAHWCAALSRYGIEYVKDPASGKYIPTCHRASFTNFLEDVDYQAAVANADPVAREQYEQDGRLIAEVQRNIIETVNKEAPFDVFICYKESDDRGQRTLDSTLAQDIYYRLTDQGYRVFFSRITLEDKAGQQYEPYIFAALHSAKVMIVIGTRPEYMNAVWVKNEWSRYLAIMKNDRSRLLIPCYRDMDPYDMPEQLSILQSYDMSRIGFIQDLIRGISKVLEAGKPKEKETVVVQTASGNTTLDAQIKRGNIALEDGDFQAADSYFDHALDIDPESAEAYFGKALAKEQCRTADQFIEKHRSTANRKTEEISVPRNVSEAVGRSVKNYAVPNYLDENTLRRLYKTYPVTYKSETTWLEQKLITESNNFTNDRWLSKAFRYAKGNFKTKLDNIRNTILSGIQSDLDQAKAADQAEQQRIMQQYVQDYQSSEQEAWKQYNQALQKREADYKSACLEMSRADDISKCEKVISDLRRIGPEYKDIAARIGYLEKAKSQLQQEKQRQLEEQQKRAAAAKRKKNFALILSVITFAAVAFVYIFVIKPALDYKEAERLLLLGEYDEAYALLEKTGNSDMVASSKYDRAIVFLDTGNYDEAYALLEEAGKSDMVASNKYDRAMSLLDSGDYKTAYDLLKEIGRNDVITSSKYDRAMILLDSNDFKTAYKLLEEIEKNDVIVSNKYDRAMSLMDSGDYKTAYDLFIEIGRNDVITSSKYDRAIKMIESGDYKSAYNLLKNLNYKDSADLTLQIKKTLMRDAKIGDYITFGAYEQDNNIANGKEDIEWIVLAKDTDKVLIISRYALDCKQYHSRYAIVDWENCSLRKWLNETFISKAFSADEQKMIPITVVTADKNPEYSTDPGNDTKDKVFLLSVIEVNKYLPSESTRRAIATKYAISQGASNPGGYCVWWLRSPGYDHTYAAEVLNGKGIKISYDSVDWKYVAVRPALWISLDSEIF